ncbi:MAG TPA: type III pantothenate kinase [Gemmatimonadales bacterium]|nr:type III pantothenate kinase [Gemmatimonadales bacterium]
MLIAFDVGNTEITVGLFSGDELTAHWRLTTHPDRTPDEWSVALGTLFAQGGQEVKRLKAGVIGSVAPAVTRPLLEGLKQLTAIPTTIVDATSPLPIVLDVEEPRSVGADRIINTLAAVERFQSDTVVVDFGTATTFDCITQDGRFLGGVIMPGLRTSADQLTRATAKLPATELEPPTRTIGRRTEECIRAGVLFGTTDAVDGLVRRILAEWPTGRKPRVVATGGLAAVIVPLSKTIELADPDLTLHGLRIAAAHLGVTW